jgi:hypothetical protein
LAKKRGKESREQGIEKPDVLVVVHVFIVRRGRGIICKERQG